MAGYCHKAEVIPRRHVTSSNFGDGILVREILSGVSAAKVIEEYPTYHKRPCVLVLQSDSEGKPVHVVWGIPSRAATPAVVVTAYRPDPIRWTEDFLRRK